MNMQTEKAYHSVVQYHGWNTRGSFKASFIYRDNQEFPRSMILLKCRAFRKMGNSQRCDRTHVVCACIDALKISPAINKER